VYFLIPQNMLLLLVLPTVSVFIEKVKIVCAVD